MKKSNKHACRAIKTEVQNYGRPPRSASPQKIAGRACCRITENGNLTVPSSHSTTPSCPLTYKKESSTIVSPADAYCRRGLYRSPPAKPSGKETSPPLWAGKESTSPLPQENCNNSSNINNKRVIILYFYRTTTQPDKLFKILKKYFPVETGHFAVSEKLFKIYFVIV